VVLHGGEELLPSIAGGREVALLDYAAEVCDAALDGLDATVSTGIEHEFRGVCDFSGLRGGEAKIHFEGDPAMRIFGTGVAAEIVFAGGEEDGWSLASGTVVESGLPGVGGSAGEGLNAAAALYADACGDGVGDEGSVERFARKRGRGKGQWRLRGAPGRGETNLIDGHGAERGYVDAERMQIFEGLTAQELSADFMAGSGLALNEGHGSSLASERDGSSTSGHSSTEDENFALCWKLIRIGRSNWNHFVFDPIL
jgi:hypothetical protein